MNWAEKTIIAVTIVGLLGGVWFHGKMRRWDFWIVLASSVMWLGLMYFAGLFH